jgi:HK97 gp10 family phage protein
MSIELEILGDNDEARLMQTLPLEIFERVQQTLKNGAIRVAERARELVPVRTGHLLASIRPDIGEEEDAEEAFQPVMVIADTPYASFVEYGTSRMDPQPFMEPAVDEVEPQILEEIDSILAEMGMTQGEQP